MDVLEGFFVEEAVCEAEDGFFEGVGCEDFGEDGAQVRERGRVGVCCAGEEAAEDAEEGGVGLGAGLGGADGWAGCWVGS